MDKDFARREIERWFPDLSVDAIELLGTGVDSDAYLVNQDWVFRFPKRPDVARGLARESALLPDLSTRLPVVVPRFTYLASDALGRPMIAGYRLLPGGVG